MKWIDEPMICMRKQKKKMNEPEEKCTNFPNFRRRKRFDKAGDVL